MMRYRWPGNVRELQNTIERAVILSENGRPISAVALGLPSDPAGYQPELPLSAGLAAEPWSPARDFEPGESAPEPAAAVHAVPVTAAGGAVLRIAELEKQAICAALQQTGGNRTQAASMLGISIRTLRNKLQEYRDSGEQLVIPSDAEKICG
jgi:DNA-binding NtrC family response regulator